MATYPAAVKSFVTRTDAVDTILAAHVNDLQAEISAVEATLGTVPAAWAGWNPSPQGGYQPTITLRSGASAPPLATATSYASVGERLDVIQQWLAWLAWVQTAQGTFAAQRAPVASVRCVGTTVPASGAAAVLWSSTEYDPYTIFQGGSVLNCPTDGWWQLTCSIWAPPTAAPGITHCLHASATVAGTEVAADGSQIPPDVGVDRHRLSLAWAGPWHSGQPLEITVRNVNGGPATVQAVASVSYLRDIR
ncbi:hypothetical protein ACFVGM_08835 [Kitasatospora purpeofusca]|uniref:hypothetical protein n=1 Tax=Kitasatospora purpeofusca TaxID=67352 RepID=UPI00367CADF4